MISFQSFINLCCQYRKTYFWSVFLGLFIVESFFVIQVIFVLPGFKLQYVVVPTLLGLTIGLLLGTVLALKNQLSEKTIELEQAKKEAENANEMKSLFYSYITHDLRSPIHSILSFSTLASKNTDNPKTIHFINNIKNIGLRLTSLVDDLLDISKFEAGKIELNRQLNDFKVIIEQAIQETNGLTIEKNINIEFLHSSETQACLVDRDLLIRVFVNLLSNAVKFSPEHSTIQIQTETLHSTTGNDHFLFSIIDQGIGIPENEIEHIFRNYEQSSSTRNKKPGTGLGLSITREIIKLHQGEIWVESPSPGQTKGSRFSFKLPKVCLKTNNIKDFDIDEIIQTHQEWVKTVNTMINEREIKQTVNVPALSNADLCTLGQWLNSLENNELLSSLTTTHHEFHLLAGECAALCEVGDFNKAAELHENFAKKSDEILNLLHLVKNSL